MVEKWKGLVIRVTDVGDYDRMLTILVWEIGKIPVYCRGVKRYTSNNMSATELLQSGKEYSDDEIRKLLSGHLCRCTGYENIFRVVKKTMLRRLGKDKEADEV